MDKREELAEKIINYLYRYPDACDTLKGIAHWWLQFERIEQTVDEVLDVLKDLERRGLIVRQEVWGGEPCYRLISKNKEILNACRDQ